MAISKSELLESVENGPYAWPGGYPKYYITRDGEALSHAAVNKNIDLIFDSIENDADDGWLVERVDINWEDPDLFCADLGVRIESAYCE